MATTTTVAIDKAWSSDDDLLETRVKLFDFWMIRIRQQNVATHFIQLSKCLSQSNVICFTKLIWRISFEIRKLRNGKIRRVKIKKVVLLRLRIYHFGEITAYKLRIFQGDAGCQQGFLINVSGTRIIGERRIKFPGFVHAVKPIETSFVQINKSSRAINRIQKVWILCSDAIKL